MRSWEDILKIIERGLPVIEGVEFKLYLDHSMEGYRVSLCAAFLVNRHRDQSEFALEVERKLHEILSNGQVRLELER